MQPYCSSVSTKNNPLPISASQPTEPQRVSGSESPPCALRLPAVNLSDLRMSAQYIKKNNIDGTSRNMFIAEDFSRFEYPITCK